VADVGTTVVGGGVVGLAVAARLARHGRDLVLLERHERHGLETSSRNSEVIHAGMYYPAGSLKARLCVEGSRRLYEACEAHHIPCRRIGKIIVAEPNVRSVAALYSPNTGIVSAHALMDHLSREARAGGATIQLRTELVSVERRTTDYRLTVRAPDGLESFSAERVVNAAGLESDTVAALCGIDVAAAGYALRWCKGSYFSVSAAKARLVSRLVYPVPGYASLGVHAVLGLEGRLRFGPDLEYLAERRADYRVREERRAAFGEAVRRLVPAIRDEDLEPDMSGIRAKLQGPGQPFRDFVIREESDRGLPGLVNLVGIDSPGLTAALAIADRVAELIAG
jgi:L-2-hydroxyglutarate oxidase LhgO